MNDVTCTKGHPLYDPPYCVACDVEEAQRTERAQHGFEWVDGPEDLRAAMMLEH